MRALALALSAMLAAPAMSPAQTSPDSTPKAVLVTGASTGIGRSITEHLAAKGYFVYAGARKEQDLKELGAIKNVQAVRLDVTNPEDITAAVDTITKAGRGLYGVVNNAGIGTRGPVTDMKWEELELVMDVNVYGPYRITRAFAPLIGAQKGRIVTIGSISGILAIPGASAYAMSKHAVEAFTDSLAGEMAPLGVKVSVVEPGNFNSQIGKNAARRMGIEPPPTADRSRYKKPDEVAAATEQALFEPNPKLRYMVVPDQSEAEITIRKQIEQLVQLNEGHPYTYDREALIKMLDEALGKARPRIN